MSRGIDWCPKHGEFMEFGPHYGCDECRGEDMIEKMRSFHARFTSGNDVPVPQATVPREEYLVICELLGGDPIGDPEPKR